MERYTPEIEEKWQRIWKEKKIFSANPNKRKKFYINVAYPYPSGAMHVGHGRTYTVPDVIARFKRMCGFNVLFPMAFHVTGTPVIGISNRISRGDEEAIFLYRNVYRVPESVLEKFSDPEEIVRYFSNEYMRIMDRMGYSIDWRRKFTTVDPQYSKFITWQFNQLKKKDLVVRGEHPVKFCPNCDNPVGDHDLLAGDKANIADFILIKFKKNGLFFPCATLRPETVYGVTNLWMNPDSTYVIADVNGERWVVSRKAVEKLGYQDYDVRILEEFQGKRFIGKKVSNPVNGNEVEILPASFVDDDMGSGVVMSVPAHAPFDYIALRDLWNSNPRYESIRPIPVIKIEGYGEIPAQWISNEMGITDQLDPKLEKATEQLYSAEYSKGVMIAGYKGVPVRDAREMVEKDLMESGMASRMYEFSERPVTCRCNTKVYVKLLKDQWFLKYSDPEWKESVKRCLERMDVLPEEIYDEFVRTVDWLNDWACTRKVGLGTPLPWDQGWIIEPLSDSTIYMAYYTISHIIGSINPDLLDDSVFDYVFLGKDGEFKIERDSLDSMRKEASYWYPYDYRFSAKDLVSNHLTFQLFHHTAIFPEEMLPRGMVVFGMGLLEGNKMSSSKGNVVLLQDAIEKYGADTVRLFFCAFSEPWQDFDWRDELVFATRRGIERFWNLSMEIIEMEDGEKNLEPIDKWLLNRLQMRIKETIFSLERFQCRKAIQHAYFGIEGDIRWYRRRTDLKRDGARWTLKYLLNRWVRLLAPFIPHIAEEIWSRIGEGLVSLSEYPKPDPSHVYKEAEIGEELIERTHVDINEIIKVTKIEPKRIILYTPPSWKRELFRSMLEKQKKEKKLDPGSIIPEAIKKVKDHKKEIPKFVQKMAREIRSMEPERIDLFLEADIDEKEVLRGAKDFFEREFGCEIQIYDAEEAEYDPQNKRSFAAPMKPAIFVEG
ncbi:MAG: leucine--tRNA ligase [Candidatus Syntropharchaeia archaeon]